MYLCFIYHLYIIIFLAYQYNYFHLILFHFRISFDQFGSILFFGSDSFSVRAMLYLAIIATQST